MDRITIETSQSPIIQIHGVEGNLRIKGWDRSEIKADSTKADTLEIGQENESVSITCHSGLILRVPVGSTITIGNVDGELLLKSLENAINITRIDGQILGKSIGSIQIGSVSGNVNVKYIEGDFTCDRGEGNLNVQDVDGSITVSECFGNLTIRGFSTSITANTEGNASLRIDPKMGEKISVKASGNINCRLEPDVSAKIHLSSGEENIWVDGFGQSERIQNQTYELIAGEGAGDINLEAEGTIDLIAKLESKSDWAFSFDIDNDISNLAEDITQVVTQQIEQQMDTLTKHLNEISSQLPGSLEEKNTQRLEAKRRSLAQKLERMDKRTTTRKYTIRKEVDTAPVTKEERQKVLEMLQNQSISVSEAEVLLAALEGKDTGNPGN